MIFSHEFRMLAQEGHLASATLLAGFEGLAKLNYDEPGSVYSALFHLSTGFERTMKVGVILDHKIKNNLASPSDAQLRNLGHSLTDLYAHLRTASEGFSLAEGWFDGDTIHGEFIATLSEFARGSRYYNIDQMVGGKEAPDPLTRWFAVHMQIADRLISQKRRSDVMDRARSHCEKFGLLGWEMGPKGCIDLTIDVTYQLEVARISRGHCVWIAIEILRPIYRLIDRLTALAHDMETATSREITIPYMYEFFPFCLATKEAAIRRKSWTTLFRFAGRV